MCTDPRPCREPARLGWPGAGWTHPCSCQGHFRSEAQGPHLGDPGPTPPPPPPTPAWEYQVPSSGMLALPLEEAFPHSPPILPPGPLQAPILPVTHPQQACPLSPAEPVEGRKSGPREQIRGLSQGVIQGALVWACPLPQRCKFQNPQPGRKLRPGREKPSGQGHTGEEGEDSRARRDGERVIQVWPRRLAIRPAHASGRVGRVSVWAGVWGPCGNVCGFLRLGVGGE